MKIINRNIGIKIGEKQINFTNMILNNYLDLYASSFKEFVDKDLSYCLVNFNNYDNMISEKSTEMKYDMVLESDISNSTEILTPRSILNKYQYKDSVEGQTWEQNKGRAIIDIGFGFYDYNVNKYIIYAYLDVSKYNIIVQDDQPIIISRIDEIKSDMGFWSNNKKIKCPYHLSKKGLLSFQGMEYIRIIPKLYSVGFGVLSNVINKEYLTENLDIEVSSVGNVKFNNVFNAQYNSDTVFFNENLFFSDEWHFTKPTYKYVIYKFKLYEEIFPDPSSEEVIWKDTGMFYLQYKEILKNGDVKMSLVYERSN